MTTNNPEITSDGAIAGFPLVDLRDEDNGRKSVPAWLLSAHLG